MRRALTIPELRRNKTGRDEFLTRPRRPITVVLDGVTQNYNIGAIFRLCDAFLVQQLMICDTQVNLRKRRLVQAAQGTQHWVPWSERQHAAEAIVDAKASGAWVLVAEQTTASVLPEQFVPRFPACLVLGGERSGVSPEAMEAADAAVAIPMLGMANSLAFPAWSRIVPRERGRLLGPDAPRPALQVHPLSELKFPLTGNSRINPRRYRRLTHCLYSLFGSWPNWSSLIDSNKISNSSGLQRDNGIALSSEGSAERWARKAIDESGTRLRSWASGVNNAFGVRLGKTLLFCGLLLLRHDSCPEVCLGRGHAASELDVDADIAHCHLRAGQRAKHHEVIEIAEVPDSE
jgi:tRNA(Leu) C34 or U34 (ribose-2'-O)-methylase TrmL